MNEFFDEHYKEYDAWYERNEHAYRSELDAVKKALPDKGCGLEIGVGSGRFAGPLGIQAGIDPSRKMVELARKRGVDAALGSGEDLSFEDSTFDYVAIIFTICFARNPEKVMAESARVLKPGGKLVVGIIDRNSFLGEFYRKKGSIFYGYARFFSIEEVAKMLKSAGFGDFSYYQTIFDYPEKLNAPQEAREGFGEGAFVVIGALKKE